MRQKDSEVLNSNKPISCFICQCLRVAHYLMWHSSQWRRTQLACKLVLRFPAICAMLSTVAILAPSCTRILTIRNKSFLWSLILSGTVLRYLQRGIPANGDVADSNASLFGLCPAPVSLTPTYEALIPGFTAYAAKAHSPPSKISKPVGGYEFLPNAPNSCSVNLVDCALCTASIKYQKCRSTMARGWRQPQELEHDAKC
jgi:hypothetical protein